jgi:preprotein translocase subunit SecF
MMQMFRNPSYNFIGNRKWAYLVSAVALAVCLASLLVQGLRYDIDFTGGTLVQVRFERTPSVADIRSALGRVGLGDAVIQEFGEAREFIVRVPLGAVSSEEMGKRVESALAQESSLGKVEVRRVEFVGPQVGRELQQQAIYAVLVGLAGILLYIAMRFDIKGGVAAVAAVFHDVVIVLGAMSLTHREFSLPVLAGVLTIIGYSVNDTIVAYDRLRENRSKGQVKGKTFADGMNDAVNQTLSRTVLTALTTFFSAFVLFLFGGRTLADFAFVLVVGVVTGTYSTIYIAAALVVDWTRYVEGRVRAKKAVAKPREARKIT